MKLRKRAKFVYVILAVLFAITFAFLGVGSGSGGLDQLFQGLNIFHRQRQRRSRRRRRHPGAPEGPEGLPRARDRVRVEGRHGERDQRAPAVHEHEAEGREGAQRARRPADEPGDRLRARSTRPPTRTGSSLTPSQSFLPTGKLGTALGTNQVEQVDGAARATPRCRTSSSGRSSRTTGASSSYEKP